MFLELYKSLERPYTSNYGKVIQNLILLNIVINIFVAFSGNFFNLSNTVKNIFLLIEYTTVFIFIIELIARYISIGVDNRYKGLKGRLFYTFTPFIIIDILSLIPYFLTNVHGDVLLARIIRFLRFFRTLKLIRLKDTIKHFFSISTFTTSSIIIQFLILFILSSFFITLFSFVYSTGDKTSLMIFLDPPSLAKTTTSTEMAFGILELLIGLFIGGALISIITELLSHISNNVRNGYHPYKDKNHVVIINSNSKLEYILEELNFYNKDEEQLKDIVIFLPFIDDIENFSQNLPKYSNLKIVLITGDVLNWNSYKRLNINFAEKIVILKDTSTDMEYLDVKIPKFLTSHSKFSNKNLDFIIESTNDCKLNMVYDEIFNSKYQYSIINHNLVIQKFLNRSIVEPDYFKVYESLLSFKEFELYTLDYEEVFEQNLFFKDANMKFEEGIIIGVIKNNKLILNPSKDLLLTAGIKLVTILKNRFEYTLNHDSYFKLEEGSLNLPIPNLKTSRNILIIGDYDNIEAKQITEFLTTDSIEKLKKIVLNRNDYLQDEFWDKEVVEKNYDMIILNLEDDFEFILTMYLRNKYKSNKKFLNSIVNIMHCPINSELIKDEKLNYNIILSEKLVGEYTTQVMYNQIITKIFDEITHSDGNEFYLLERKNYSELFEMSYDTLKINLLDNKMIYIGAIREGEFIVDYKEINSAEKIVVLTEGDL